jgi:hypothetical protein
MSNNILIVMKDIHRQRGQLIIILLSLKEGKQDEKWGLQLNSAIHKTKNTNGKMIIFSRIRVTINGVLDLGIGFINILRTQLGNTGNIALSQLYKLFSSHLHTHQDTSHILATDS